MISNPATLALAAWLLPALSFLVLAIVAPFRRLGRPAAWFSTTCAAAAFVSALIAWTYGSQQIAKVVYSGAPAIPKPLLTFPDWLVLKLPGYSWKS